MRGQRAFEGVDRCSGAFDLGRGVRAQGRHAQHGLDEAPHALGELHQRRRRAIP
jgi:hypothetical protein